MGLPVSDVNQMCEVALRMAVEQFQVGDIQAGYRYFKVVQSRPTLTLCVPKKPNPLTFIFLWL